MTVFLTVLLFVSVPLLVLVVAQRVTRPASHVPPRRRELNRERKIALSAQTTLLEVRQLLAYYRPLLDGDDVGLGLLTDVQLKIAEHDQRMLEVNK